MKYGIQALLVFASLFLGAQGLHAQGESSPFAFENVAVVDVVDGSVDPGMTVLVRGDRIERVGETGTVEVPSGATVVDATGEYLIPGLWDAHVHSSWARSWHFPLLVAYGITSVRNMHTTVDTALQLTSAIQRRLASGEVLGPRFLANGPIIDGDPPAWPGAVVARTAAEGRAAVDSLAEGGADFIKVYDNLLPQVYEAILDEARRIDVPVDGHVPFLVRPERAAAAGQRTVEHTSGINLGCSTKADSLRGEFRSLLERVPSMGPGERVGAFFRLVGAAGDSRDPELCRRTARAYRESGMSVVPTLVVSEPGRAAALVADPARMALLPREVRERWKAMAASGPGPIAAAVEGGEWPAPENTRLLHDDGVRILAGTDIGNPFLVPGPSLHDELALLVNEAGLSPLEALRAATIGPARTFGMADSLGAVAEGRLADLVLLEENPLEDIHATTSIVGVVLNGRYLDRTALDELTARASR